MSKRLDEMWRRLPERARQAWRVFEHDVGPFTEYERGLVLAAFMAGFVAHEVKTGVDA